MVSIDRIQKTSQLSEELKKHGFAEDFEDAYKQAENIYNNKQVVIAKENESVVVENLVLNEQDVIQLLERMHKLERHKYFSNIREQKYQEQVSELINKINEIVKSIQLIEMNQVNFEKKFKNDVQQIVESPNNDVHKQPPQEQQVSPVGQDSTPDNRKNLTEPIDRNGIAPADISIEKIFYFGNK